jgi:hypothetical protein
VPLLLRAGDCYRLDIPARDVDAVRWMRFSPSLRNVPTMLGEAAVVLPVFASVMVRWSSTATRICSLDPAVAP